MNSSSDIRTKSSNKSSPSKGPFGNQKMSGSNKQQNKSSKKVMNGSTSSAASSCTTPSDDDERHPNRLSGTSGDEDELDIYGQLAQKDRDLILAAELGKALLERNEELTRANERITEDYSHKLELLEQEKHGLRRRLDNLESEYESQISELQSDLNAAKKQLEDNQNLMRQTEKENSKVVQELMEQNHRLTRELKKASESEESVSSQLQSLREQFHVRRSNLHDHVAQLESLREEIMILDKRKSELDKRIQNLTEERSSLTMSLEESSDRIIMLEKKNQELETSIQNQLKELDELRHSNTQLHNKLDSLLRHRNSMRSSSNFHRSNHNRRNNNNLNNKNQLSTSPSTPAAISNHNHSNHTQPTSLFNEIEMSSSSSIEEELSKTFGIEDGFDDDDLECDVTPAFPSYPTDGNSPSADELFKFRQEITEIYHDLRRVVRDLHRRRDVSRCGTSLNSTPDSGIPATPEEIQTNQIRVGLIKSIMRELQSVLKEIFPDDDGPCAGCRSVAIERTEFEKLKKEVNERKEVIKRLNDEKNELTKQVTILDVELKSAKEERDNMKESFNCQNLPKDEIIKRAFELRDAAVSRKNMVEIELAKARIEVMHINSQLMESVQQKVELSQQLEQWQVDMQSLLDDQLRQKLTEHEMKKRSSSSGNLLSTNGSNASSTTVTSVKNGLAAGLMNKSKLLKLWR